MKKNSELRIQHSEERGSGDLPFGSCRRLPDADAVAAGGFGGVEAGVGGADEVGRGVEGIEQLVGG